FDTPMMGWKVLKKDEAQTNGKALIHNAELTNPANRRYIRITSSEDERNFGLSNEGFRGMGIKEGNQYDFSVLARQAQESNVKLVVEVIDEQGNQIGTATLAPEGNSWSKHEVSFTATATAEKAKMNLWMEGKGEIDLDMISLFPKDTWKGRPGGLRKDMIQLLADMKPGFFRFPGGCIVEGRTLDERFQWKKTIGPIEERELIVNRWNTEFKHRL